MEFNTIRFTLEADIATITFNRPKALNALSSEVLREFAQALDHLAANEAVRTLILTGSGDKAFVAGADITELATFNALQAKRFAKAGHEVLGRLQALPIPVIAAVNGYALGGGTEVALACDFIYASENAMFGLPEIKLGLIPGFGGTQRLARQIGKNLAKELIFTGRMVSAAEAQQMGLVNKVLPLSSLMETAAQTAQEITRKGRVSLRAAKEAVNGGMDVDLATGCKMEIDAFALCVASEDAKEGTAAFLEKREATFSGKLS
jgi:enoyl-CoA hydratase